MSSTAKEKLQILTQMIEDHMRVMTHPGDRAGYVQGAREVLRLSSSQTSRYATGHASAVDGR